MSATPTGGTASYKIGLFGVPTAEDTAQVIVIPVPWEVTTSYGAGTSEGPLAVWRASAQIDLFDLELGNAYEKGYHLLPISEKLIALNNELKPLALNVRTQLENSGGLNKEGLAALERVNIGGREMTAWVHQQSRKILNQGKIPVVLGGDHSSPEGNIQAVCEAYPDEVGVLHFDAHADLRVQYQGFERSHASIMNNVMNASWKPKKLVQVGIRDFCEEEFQQIEEREDIETFFDLRMKQLLFSGTSWREICDRIVNALPDKVYVSFDIDGLSPEYCPHTGTPVPGGLSFDQANYLLHVLHESGRQIVGFDLNEVSPSPDENDEWDGNVGARLLYKLCGWSVLSQPR